MEPLLDVGVVRVVRGATVGGHRGAEAKLGSCAEPLDDPWEVVPFDQVLHTSQHAGAELAHAHKGLVGQNVLERTASRSQRQSVTCERATDATRIDVVALGVALDLNINHS